MKANRGRLIVFEGVDAAGKTTLSNELCVLLRHNYQSVRHCQFPGRQQGTLGELVYRLHHFHSSTFGVPKIAPCSLQLLHIAAHVDAIELEIKPALQDGEWVVLDRFWWSTYVYGLDDGVSESQLQLMIDIEKNAWGSIRPDIVFLVDSAIPLRDDEANSIAWQRKRQTYNRLAVSEENIQKCLVLETGKGDNAKHRAMSKIQEAICALSEGSKGEKK
ncbi:MAG: hypothetical protein OEV28_08780 [Nitrospirota bacterium]|nr:hypothetical protein [Nitrospirota bacterium]